MPSYELRQSIRYWTRHNGRLRRVKDQPIRVLRRSPRLAAKEWQEEASPINEWEDVPAPPICSMTAHEAKCAWCGAHPEWRRIKDNLNLMLAPYNDASINGKAARAASAMAIMSYLNEVAIHFVRAHKNLLKVVIDRCQHCIEKGEEYPILRMLCSDLMRKLTE